VGRRRGAKAVKESKKGCREGRGAVEVVSARGGKVSQGETFFCHGEGGKNAKREGN